MSRDTDANERLWKHLGYGRRTSSPDTWRYWEISKGIWTISAPKGLAEFEQRGSTVYYKGEVVVDAKTQWSGTWEALAFFYREIVQTLPKPPIDPAQSDT